MSSRFLSGNSDNEERVWIMDPDVLEESARDHQSPQPDQSQYGQPAEASPPTFSSQGHTRLHWSASNTTLASKSGARDPDTMSMSGIMDPRFMSDVERNYLLSVERGDMASVRSFLNSAKKNGSMNINCIDPLGRSSLLIAIENENVEMIRLLLEHNVETGDALLYAINEENVEAVETLLRHLDDIGKFDIETQGVDISEHSAFTPDITPIVLAAHRDNYEIINLLHSKRAFVPHPHDVRCACRECLEAQAEDSLRFSKSRINTYRALSSPSLICICQRDPLMYAFELGWELRRLSVVENEFKIEYQELSQKCQKFCTDLLDQTRGSAELEIILNHDTSDRMVFKDRESERMQLARLKFAIQLRQKRFVAHPNCQQLLASMWYEGLPGFRRRNVIFKVLLIMCVILGFPILPVLYLLAPKSAIGQFIRKPFVKFLCHSASYVIFLFLLILASQRLNYDSFFSSSVPLNSTNLHDDPDRKERRGPPPTPVEWAILAWIAGLVWTEIKQLWDLGIYEYCHNMWNILDFITNSLYLCTIALRFIAYVQVENEIANGYAAALGRHLQRKNWDAWDPTLISECIFATANIFSSLKLVHMFTVNPHLGPLQISLGRMVFDIMKFFFVYSLVLFAFACGLNQLFWYYATMRSKECEQGKADETEAAILNLPTDTSSIKDLLESCEPKYSAFANLFNTVETLFWSIFGLIDLDRFSLKESHDITEWAGKTMFGTYGIISIVVLLNMLIAMMSNSYQYISNQSDVEWKFARSRLWIAYFEENGTLPPPFNIIPSPKAIYYLIASILEKCHCNKRIHHTKQRSMRLQKILRAVSDKEKMYKRVMDNLVKRYVSFVQRQKQQGEGVSEDDVNEIKQDISAFRYEMLDILKRNNFDTGHANIAQRTTARNKKKSAMAERMMKNFAMDVEPIPELDELRTITPNRAKFPRPRGENGSNLSTPRTSPKRFTPKLSRFKKLSRRFPGLSGQINPPPSPFTSNVQWTPQAKRSGTKAQRLAHKSMSYDIGRPEDSRSDIALAGLDHNLNISQPDIPSPCLSVKSTPLLGSNRDGSRSISSAMESGIHATSFDETPVSEPPTAASSVPPRQPHVWQLQAGQLSANQKQPSIKRQEAMYEIEPEPNDVTL